MAQTRYYRNGSPASTLSGNINAAVTTVPVTAVTTWPSTVPYAITVDKGLSTAEVMLVTFVSGVNLTVTRGYDGTTAVSHSIGATVQPTVIALDFTEANAHANTTTGVHGTTGSVVGTAGTQTLSGKTLTAPVLTAPSITGGVTVTGTAALAATTASSVTASGTVQGATLTSTGNVGGSTLTTSSNASVGGTLGVTGAVSANAGVTTTTLTTTGAASLASGTVTAVGAGTTALPNRQFVEDFRAPRQYARYTATASVPASTITDVTLTAAAESGVANDTTTYTLTSGRVQFNQTGIYLIQTQAETAGILTYRRLSDVVVHSGSAFVGSRTSIPDGEFLQSGCAIVVVTGTGAQVKVQAFQSSPGALTVLTTWRVSKLSPL